MDLPKLLFLAIGAAAGGVMIWSIARTIRIERDWRRTRPPSAPTHHAAGDVNGSDTDSLDSGGGDS